MVGLTKSTKPVKGKEVKRDWYLVDAKNKILGRLVSPIVRYLTGKHKANFVPYLDMGDYVVVINVKSVILTGRKEEKKVYRRYSGYPGGLKIRTFMELKKTKPEEIIKRAVSGMLPKNKLRDRRMARLYVFADEKNPYEKKIKS